MKSNNSKGAIFTGIFAAIAASSCCISPLIALIAGVGGASSSLVWIEPFRPYLIVFAVLAIGYAWYLHLKPKQEDDCGCEIEKLKFYQKRGFLIGMTIFGILSITLPYYSGIFYPNNSKEVIVADSKNITEIEIKIEGMTCASCENHINHAVNKLNGIIEVSSSYDNRKTMIKFDKSQTNIEEIIDAINSTGYKAIENE